MENSISVYGAFNQDAGASSDQISEEAISNEETFVASEIVTERLPKTGEITSFDFLFLGLLLCLILMILQRLRYTRKNRDESL